MGCECSTEDVLNFVVAINGTQKAKVFVTVKSECRESSDGCQVTYTVTNDASADTNVSSISVGDHDYIFEDATAKQVLPGQVGTVTVVRPGADCMVTSDGALTLGFPALGGGGPQYKGIRVCTLRQPSDGSPPARAKSGVRRSSTASSTASTPAQPDPGS